MKRDKKVALICGLIIAIGIIARIVYVNIEHPQVRYQDIAIGKAANWDNNVELTVEKTEVYHQEEAIEKYGDDIVDEYDDGDVPFRVIEVQVLLNNRDESMQEVYLYDLYIENRVYSNGIPEEVQYNTEDDELVWDIQPGESCEVKLCYKVFDDQVGLSEDDEFPVEDFWLSGKHYPVKNRWRLG